MIDLRRARAHWVTRDLLVLPGSALPEGIPAQEWCWGLALSAEGSLDPGDPAEVVPLAPAPGPLPRSVARRHRRLAAGSALPLRLPAEHADRAEVLLTGQVAVLAHDGDRALRLATSVQIPGVLDDLYAGAARPGRQGVTWCGPGPGDRAPTVRVWAPTARRVTLLLWDGRPEPGSVAAWAPTGVPLRLPMAREPDGSWALTGTPAWLGRCYRFELDHVLPGTGRRASVQSTDPWSVALSLDSTHSVLVDLQDPALAPDRWRRAPTPPPLRAVDQAVYELHVRDFSRDDESVPPGLRGSYLAFGHEGRGREHLRELARAGLTTVHLLPVFDLTSVPEDRRDQVVPEARALATLPPDGEEQQRRVRAAAGQSPFNWGYDPWHFLAPEGSYADSEGAAHGGGRVAQCRDMVGALHELGLRVVLDQVWNHTTDSGLDRTSVLDRVVPGYYHRLDQDGGVETSTCCQNLATEHTMAQQLMVDGCVLWVRHYRVDGFRFDLMGHHSRRTMQAVRAALDELTPEVDGVDGTAVHLYGEGWDFGEVAGNALFHQAVQGQLAGTGIGTFNDRFRDALRGGGVHDEDPREGRGFVTGGARDPQVSDQVQLGLAGGLRDVTFRSQASGRPVTGARLRYEKAPAGYAREPEDVVNYVDAHDNETLWDTLVLKLPQDTPMVERVRRNTLALAAVTLSQGISFWHAGAELLRSKSLDRNSYASGDWFNRYDVALSDNGFGRGLPPEPDNGPRWPVMAPLLADPALVPSPQDMRRARDQALDLLRLRRDLPLLRLGSARRIRSGLTFPVSGTGHGRPDLVVMLITDTGSDQVDPDVCGVLVLLNAATERVRQPLPGSAGQHWELAAVQRDGADEEVRSTRWDAARGAVEVPPLTAAVLVRPRPGSQPRRSTGNGQV